jgi:hypothetical protein
VLHSLDDDAIGVVFRHTGPGDFYRFSMDSQRGYRRLVRCSGGVFALLWDDRQATRNAAVSSGSASSPGGSVSAGA